MPAKGVVLLQRGVICREEIVLWVGNYVGDSVYSIEGYFYTPRPELGARDEISKPLRALIFGKRFCHIFVGVDTRLTAPIHRRVSIAKDLATHVEEPAACHGTMH